MKIAFITSDDREDLRRYSDPHPYFGTAPSALLQGFSTLPECEVHVVCCTQRPLPSPQKLAQNIYYHSLEVGKWGWLRGGYIGCVRAIREKLRPLKPDLVHGQGTERYCALGAVFSGFPNLLTIHGNMRQIARVTGARPFSFLWLTARLERLALARTGGVVCQNTHTLRLINSAARRTWIVPNAVASVFFDIAPRPQVPPQVLCVGDVLIIKNQIALIRALDPLVQQRPLRVVFCGKARRGDRYVEDFFSLVNQRPWCSFAGFLSREELQSALGKASGLVLPSLEDNCPMAVLEAMAAGVPVAAAKVGGVPDLVRDGIEGVLFDPEQPENIRCAVARLVEDRQGAASLAAAARNRALTGFHPRVIAQGHLAIYREVLSAKASPGASP